MRADPVDGEPVADFLGVFAAELEEIRARRSKVGQPGSPREGEATPGTAHGLVGLALSGGGIRSASFSLGVVQQLIAKGVFPRFDYLSTVSGGGYTGSCLSALMQGGPGRERALVDRDGGSEPPAVNHLRNGSDYLISGGLLNQLRLPAVIVFGAAQTLLLMLPLVVGAVLLTEVFFEITARYETYVPVSRALIPIVGFAPLMVSLFLRPVKDMRRAGRNWSVRDREDRRLAAYLSLAILSLAAVPTLAILDLLVNSGPATVYGGFRDAVAAGLASAARGRGWLLWGGLGIVTAAVLAVRRWKSRVVLPLVGVAGPLALVGVYLLACLHVINSPIVLPATSQAIATDVRRGRLVPGDNGPATAFESVMDVLGEKRLTGTDYAVALDATGGILTLRYAEDGGPLWWSWLTTSQQPTLAFRLRNCRAEGSTNCTIEIDQLSLLGGHAEWWFYLGGLTLFLFNTSFVNVNRISIHSFYRDRLSHTFLIRPDPVPSAGDTLKAPLGPADDLRLSHLNGPGSTAPYHLINCALNLHGSANPQLRDRKTAPLVLSKRYCGSELLGYCQTEVIERYDPLFNLGSAMAISAAAAAPNMGTMGTGPLSFVMAMLNMRLNYWMPNPARVASWSRPTGSLLGQPGLGYLWQEATGLVDERRNLVNCSDGGHFENLAVYELIRRRCRTIVCVDGEADPKFEFHGFNTLQRYALMDFGATIDLDLTSLVPDESGCSPRQYAVGQIEYADGERGKLVYLKLSFGGSEPQYVRFYRKSSPVFPHEPTSDQFFDETQFEVYRALGAFVAGLALRDAAVLDALGHEEGGP